MKEVLYSHFASRISDRPLKMILTHSDSPLILISHKTQRPDRRRVAQALSTVLSRRIFSIRFSNISLVKYSRHEMFCVEEDDAVGFVPCLYLIQGD